MSLFDDSVWGVNSRQEVYNRKGQDWNLVAGKKLVVVSAGEAGVWGVDKDKKVFLYRSEHHLS